VQKSAILIFAPLKVQGAGECSNLLVEDLGMW